MNPVAYIHPTQFLSSTQDTSQHDPQDVQTFDLVTFVSNYKTLTFWWQLPRTTPTSTTPAPHSTRYAHKRQITSSSLVDGKSRLGCTSEIFQEKSQCGKSESRITLAWHQVPSFITRTSFRFGWLLGVEPFGLLSLLGSDETKNMELLVVTVRFTIAPSGSGPCLITARPLSWTYNSSTSAS